MFSFHVCAAIGMVSVALTAFPGDDPVHRNTKDIQALYDRVCQGYMRKDMTAIGSVIGNKFVVQVKGEKTKLNKPQYLNMVRASLKMIKVLKTSTTIEAVKSVKGDLGQLIVSSTFKSDYIYQPPASGGAPAKPQKLTAKVEAQDTWRRESGKWMLEGRLLKAD